MKLKSFIITGVSVLALGMISYAEINTVVIDRNAPVGDATERR